MYPRCSSRALLSVWVGLGAAAAAWGCGDECRSLEVCDIRRSECQAQTAAVAVCLSGNESVQPQVNVVDAQSYIEQQASEAEAAPPTDDQLARLRALALLNLMPAELELRALETEYWGTVAAFYDTETAEVTVLDRGYPMDESAAVLTLLHEMVHAMQFQRETFSDIRIGDIDGALARSALIEGEAELYEDLAKAFGFGYEPADIDWQDVYWNFQVRSWSGALETSAPYSLASRYFSYAFGGAFLHGAWEQGGNAAVRELFTAPPLSTRHILEGYGAPPPFGLPSWREDPDSVGSPSLPPTYEPVSVTHLGSWLFELFRQHRLGASPREFYRLGQGFLGDVLSVFRGPAAGEVTLFWRLRFESEERAAELMRELDDALEAPRLAHLQFGRDVVIAASTAGTLPNESIQNTTWGPVPAPEGASAAPESDSLLGRPRLTEPSRARPGSD